MSKKPQQSPVNARIQKSKKIRLLAIPLAIVLLILIYLAVRGASMFQLNQQQEKFTRMKQDYFGKITAELNLENFADESQYYKGLTNLFKFESKNTEIQLTQIKNATENISFMLPGDRKLLADFQGKLAGYGQNLAKLTDLGVQMETQEENLNKYYEIRQYVFTKPVKDKTKDFLPAERRYDYISLENPGIIYGTHAYYELAQLHDNLAGLTTENGQLKQFLDFINQNVNEELQIATRLSAMEKDYDSKKVAIEEKYGKPFYTAGIYVGKTCIESACLAKMKELRDQSLPAWSTALTELVDTIKENKQQMKDLVLSWTENIK